MNARQAALTQWLTNECKLSHFTLTAMPHDASFRRYFRITDSGKTYVAMDAPPEHENCIPFVAIAKALCELGLHAPQVIAQDTTRGFLLLSDLGDRLYLNELNTSNADTLYGQALSALATLRTCQSVPDWPLTRFDASKMRQELELCKEWFLSRHLNIDLSESHEKMLAACFAFLVDAAAKQPYVFTHRDYHSANLMVLPNQQIGLLDFQDAFFGPVTYDVVSLLRDCYIDWPDEDVTKWALHYRDTLTNQKPSESEFLYWFDCMGMQRHLKALLTFARKYRRDHNSNYLRHMPRTVNYLLMITQRYPETKPFYEFLKNTIVEKLGTVCAE